MSKRKVIKVDADVFEAAKGALNIFILEMEHVATDLEGITGPTDRTREMFADAEILFHIFDALSDSARVDQDPPGLFESAKRPSLLN